MIKSLFIPLAMAAALVSSCQNGEADLIAEPLAKSEVRSYQAAPKVERAPAATQEVTADKLIRDFEANKIRAKLTYHKKRFIVSGVISDFGMDVAGSPYFTLESYESAPSTVTVYFPKGTEGRVALLEKGFKFRADCLIGRKMLGVVIVRECRVAES